MLIDMHAHTSGGSRCCQSPYDVIMKIALENGMDGIVLANHYDRAHLKWSGVKDSDPVAYAQFYIDEFLATEKCGKEMGCKVFFGIEVSMELYPKVHMLVYGVSTDFLLKNPCLYDMTQKDLYELVKANGGTLVQAHPFRGGTTVLDTNYMDGVEINCHPIYGKSYAEELIEIAEKNHLYITSGGDFHDDTPYRAKCGVYLPDDTKDQFDLCRYLLAPGEKTLCIQEPNCTEIYDYTYVSAFDKG